MAAPVELTDAHSGGRVRVPAGAEVVLTLRENPTTGFRWQSEVSSEALTETGSTFATGAAGAPMEAADPRPGGPVARTGPVGAGGLRTFRFRADAPGVVRIRTRLVRPWQSEAAPIDTFEVTLDVG